MRKLLLPLLLIAFFQLTVHFAIAQNSIGIGTNTPRSSAILDVTSQNQGLLFPRVDTTNITGLGLLDHGLVVYDTVVGEVFVWDGTTWQNATQSPVTPTLQSAYDGGQTVNMGTGNIDFISSSANSVLYIDEANENVGIGTNTPNASYKLDVLGGDVLIHGNTVGRGGGNLLSNTVFGDGALANNTTGAANTAIGNVALSSNTNGQSNVAVGINTMRSMSIGQENVALGASAMDGITSGSANTIVGQGAYGLGTTGNNNTALGRQSLLINEGNSNTAIGVNAMRNNTTGSLNTTLGASAEVALGGLNNATAIGANTVVGASNSLVLGNNANVGIGTSTPVNKLEVIGDAAKFDSVIIANNAQAGYVLTAADGTGAASWQPAAAGNSWILSGNTGTNPANDFIGTTDNTSLVLRTNNTAKLTINPNGNIDMSGAELRMFDAALGFGTTKIVNTGIGGLIEGYDPAHSIYLRTGFGGSNDRLELHEFGTIGFYTGGAIGSQVERIHIGFTGNVGIGTSTPANKLEVIGDAAKFDSVIIANNAQAGYVLTAMDATGAASWQAAGAGTSWNLSGNSATLDGTDFFGTTDNVPLNFRTNNIRSGRIEPDSPWGTFFGFEAGLNNGASQANVAIGYQALRSFTSAANTAIGYRAMTVTNGGQNVAVGNDAMSVNTNGSQNTAVGSAAMANLNGANHNTGVGLFVLNQSTGDWNTSMGSFAGSWNSSGTNNTFLGYQAGYPQASVPNAISTGSDNVMIGANTGLSQGAQVSNSVAIGSNARIDVSNAMALGATGASRLNVGINTNTPNPNADLTLNSNDRGLQLNKVDTTTLQPSLGINDHGLVVYDTVIGEMFVWNGTNFALVGGASGATIPANVFSAKIDGQPATLDANRILSQSYNFVQSVTRTGSGTYNIIFIPGFFTEAPSIMVTVNHPGLAPIDASAVSITSAGFSVYTGLSNVAIGDNNFDILAQRQGADYQATLTAPPNVIGQWDIIGSDLNYTAGNVGIGTTTPVSPLHISSAAVSTTLLVTNNAIGTSNTDGLLIGENNSGTALILNYENERMIIGTNSNLNQIMLQPTGSIGLRNIAPFTDIHLGEIPAGGEFTGTNEIPLAAGSRVLITSQNNNGGTINAAAEPVLMLHRAGVNGQSFSQLAGFSLSRYSNATNASFTQLDINLLEGINSGNFPAIMSLRSNGNVGIGTIAPTSALDVVGDINLTGEVNRTSTGTTNLLPIAMGSIAPDGTVVAQSGNITCVYGGSGTYRITITGVTLTPEVIVSINTNSGIRSIANYEIIGGDLIIFTHDGGGGGGNQFQDHAFSFLVFQI